MKLLINKPKCRLTYVGRGLKFLGSIFNGRLGVVASHTWGEDWNGVFFKFCSCITVASHTWGEDWNAHFFCRLARYFVASHTWGEDWNVMFDYCININIVASHTWGEDWNQAEIIVCAFMISRLTYVGRGLKCIYCFCLVQRHSVASHTWGEDWNCNAQSAYTAENVASHTWGEDWNNHFFYIISVIIGRLTYVGRGLKSYAGGMPRQWNGRLTYVGRGLKCPLCGYFGSVRLVASHTWGEDWNISEEYSLVYAEKVASHTWGEDWNLFRNLYNSL